MKQEIELRSKLLGIEKPGRYIGGEYGSGKGPERETGPVFRIVLCFPDLYEIGMSNLAVRMLYDRLNALEGIVCERVFAPAADMEQMLREEGIALFSLESGTPLKDFDLIAFSIGYELLASNVLMVLDLGGIPYLREERAEDDPVVIAGGPALTNPAPWNSFLDAVCIGEAESILEQVFPKMYAVKKGEAGPVKTELLAVLNDSVPFHMCDPAYGEKSVVRGVDVEFGRMPSVSSLLPVPNIRTVQDHGVIEIMRGCGNACRFCHAGYFYRPRREKTVQAVIAEAESLVFECGYREITLSSLSTGDYGRINELLTILNERYSRLGVSFSLPSLRINSFTLELLDHISSVRKSGLTFAVETPLPEWQRRINKEAPLEKTIEILKHAKKLGWKQAKFYFMIGLPLGVPPEEEAEKIVDYLNKVQREARIFIHVNIGTFVPKPHTPFQRDSQLDPETAQEMIFRIKDGLSRKYFKVSYHHPFLSLLEGLISRGDERAGLILRQAYEEGARFDAWEDKILFDVWKNVIDSREWNVRDEILKKRSKDEKLPWDTIRMRISPDYIRREKARAEENELTGSCGDICREPCGSCSNGLELPAEEPLPAADEAGYSGKAERTRIKVLFSFSKTGKAQYLSHLNIMTIFERTVLRAGFDAVYSEGFNPKPRIEFAHPLPLGVESFEDAASLEIYCSGFDGADFAEKMNEALPEGFSVLRAQTYPSAFPSGKKPKSLMASYWGGDFLIEPVPFKSDGVCADEASVSFERLKEYQARHPELAEVRTDRAAGTEGCVITLKEANSKAGNIKTVLEECTGLSAAASLPANRVVRLASYAYYTGRESAAPETKTDFFTAYTFQT